MRRWSILLLLPTLAACVSIASEELVLSEGGENRNPAFPDSAYEGNPTLGHEGFALLLNDRRDSAGVVAVIEDSRLSAAAQSHAQDMVTYRYWAHTDRNGNAPGDRALAQGYDWNYIAENIARGFYTNEAVLQAWADSPGHATNLVDERAEDFGLGYVDGTWVLLMGREFD